MHEDHHGKPYYHVCVDPPDLVAGWTLAAAGVFKALLPLPLALTVLAAYMSMGLVYEWVHFFVHTRLGCDARGVRCRLLSDMKKRLFLVFPTRRKGASRFVARFSACVVFYVVCDGPRFGLFRADRGEGEVFVFVVCRGVDHVTQQH